MSDRRAVHYATRRTLKRMRDAEQRVAAQVLMSEDRHTVRVAR